MKCGMKKKIIKKMIIRSGVRRKSGGSGKNQKSPNKSGDLSTPVIRSK